MQRSVASDWYLSHSHSCWIFSVWRSAYSWNEAPSAFPDGTGYEWRSGTFNVLFNYCIHSRGQIQQRYRVHAAATMWGQNATWWFVHDWGLYKLHSSVHSASSHTGSVQIPFRFEDWLDVKFRSLDFIQSGRPNFFDRLLVLVSSSQIPQFCTGYIPNHLECIGSVNRSFCHVIRVRNELIRSVEHLVQH